MNTVMPALDGEPGQVASRTPIVPICKGLQPRWCGLDERGVAANQRLRLFAAMIKAVELRGYAGTSVNELAKLAGVSKRTVYDRFENKEQYFLATYDLVVGRAIRRISAAYRQAKDPALGLCNALQVFLQEAVDEPGAVRLAVLEALGAGPAALARMERARIVFERMIASSVPSGEKLPPMIIRGMVGGVEQVTRLHLLAGEIPRLIDSVHELSDWVACYEPDAAARIAALPRRELRLRTQGWTAWMRCEDERTRLLRTAAVVAGREGYDNLTPERVVGLARTAPEVFKEHFSSVEECFLSSLELLGIEALACAAKASLEPEDWVLGTIRGIDALTVHMASQPVLAQIAFVEAFSVGPGSIHRRIELLSKFEGLLMRRIPADNKPRELMAQLLVGAIWSIAHRCTVRDAKHLLPVLAEQISFLVLAPVIGSESAAEAIIANRGVALAA